jgi:hypothetical protein
MGMNFVDDWGSYTNAVQVRTGCDANLLFTVTAISPPTFIVRVISNATAGGSEINLTGKFGKKVPVEITTASGVTLTAAQIVGGMILRDPNGSVRTDNTPTAEQIVDYLALPENGGVKVGAFVEFTINNIGEISEDINLTQGDGVTIYGGSPMTLTAPGVYSFVLVVDNITAGAEAVTIYPK